MLIETNCELSLETMRLRSIPRIKKKARKFEARRVVSTNITETCVTETMDPACGEMQTIGEVPGLWYF